MGSTTKTGRDIISILVSDHREVEALFARLEHMGSREPELRRRLVDELITELVGHSMVEEEHLYPAVRECVPGGAELADREIREHAEAERTMKELADCEPDDPRFETLLSALMTQIRAHVAEEEGNLFPRLSSACGPGRLSELGHQAVAEKLAPGASPPDRT